MEMIRVRVPATSANLGPGFDTLGLALNIYNEFSFEEIPSGLEILGCEEGYRDEDNLIYQAILRTFEKLGYEAGGIRITIESEIPMTRGLGSSASCILAGVMGANKMAGSSMTREEVFKLACEIEGHPDNLAPALFGGLVTSVMETDDIYYNRIDIAPGLKFMALIPDFGLSTEDSRRVLPERLTYSDGVYNIGRVSLMLSALVNGRFDLLRHGLKDKVHEEYRGKLIPNYDRIIKKCEELDVLGTYLSGAGPTIIALVEEGEETFKREIEDFLSQLQEGWQVRELSVDLEGASFIS